MNSNKSNRRDLILIGASSGGVTALCGVLKALPRDLKAAICVVIHIGHASRLAASLKHCTSLTVEEGEDGTKLQYGRVYVAPSSKHMVIQNGAIRLTSDPKENGSRPAIDPLFRTASNEFGRRVIAVILTGDLDDGAAGIFTVKARGGLTIVQKPENAFAPSMPKAALRYTDVDFCLPVDQIGAKLTGLVGTVVKNGQIKEEASVQDLALSSLICPDCGGPLFENTSGPQHFSCRIGHKFSPDALTKAQTAALEHALWSAVQKLTEHMELYRRISSRFGDKSSTEFPHLKVNAESAEKEKEVLEGIIRRFRL